MSKWIPAKCECCEVEGAAQVIGGPRAHPQGRPPAKGYSGHVRCFACRRVCPRALRECKLKVKV